MQQDERQLSLPSVIRSQQLPPIKSYGDYQDVLRWDFWYSCAYCTVTEIEYGARPFSIDHYRPQSRFPVLKEVYSNLMWSCGECNSNKLDEPRESLAVRGYRFFKADEDRVEDHFRMSGERVEPLDELVGNFTIEVLKLNRQHLRRLRRIRADLEYGSDAMLKGLRALNGIAIQSLPTQLRHSFLAVRKKLQTSGETLMADEIREAARSFFADVDVVARDHDARQRREFLRSLGAHAPSQQAVKT